MTHEILDLFENIVKDTDLVNRMSFAINIRDYILLLEAKIAELEAPKSCDGCKWYVFLGSDNCTNCVRGKWIYDNYQPKDTK